jgi:hypothetical protein
LLGIFPNSLTPIVRAERDGVLRIVAITIKQNAAKPPAMEPMFHVTHL